MVVKFLLSKVIVRCKARVFLLDTIRSRSHKIDSAVVAKIFFAAAQGTKMCCTKHYDWFLQIQSHNSYVADYVIVISKMELFL